MAARSQSETGALDADKLIAEIANNYGGTANKTNNGFSVNATVDGKSFSVDGDGNVTGGTTQNQGGKVTLEKGDGTKVGDIIAITSTKGTTEKFYILADNQDKTKVKALAMYNLKVGTNYDSDENKIEDIATTVSGYGLQDSEMKGWLDGQGAKGTLSFSNSQYWNDTYKTQENSGFPWVYNNKSNLYKYVESYKTLLGNKDKVSEVSLASYEDINKVWSNKSQYSWIYSTSYWLGSVYDVAYSGVYCVNTKGDFFDYYKNYCNNRCICGVRPVITIDISKI